MLGICLDNVRKTVPLVHNITNYVTVNDVANILLACGGSPIMSDERRSCTMCCCWTPWEPVPPPCAPTPPWT